MATSSMNAISLMNIYLVGGAVRDALLEIPVKDRDWLVTGATPEQMLAQNFQQVGADFPVFLHPNTKEEYALARTERKSGQGYKGFNVDFNPDITLDQDLERRDLTINAMAQDSNGHLHDPFNGQSDLKDKILRHVSPAFREDPLRVLRVARFAARFDHLGFSVASETLDLMIQLSISGELNTLTPERVWQETQRALTERSPWVYFEVLRRCSALQIIMPELDNLFGVPQPMKWHPEIDTGIHTLKALQVACSLSDDTEVRFATLCHDLGKAESDPDNLPHHHGHEKRGIKLVKQLCRRLKTQNSYKDLAMLASEFHTHCHRIEELKPATIFDFLNRLGAFKKTELLKKFLLVCTADSRGRSGFETREYKQADLVYELAVAAQQVDVSNLQKQGYSGPELGEQIRQTRIKIIAEEKSKWQQY